MLLTRQMRAEQAVPCLLSMKPMDVETAERLEALGASTTPETVDEIIGDDLLTVVYCDRCMQSVDAAFRMAGSSQFCKPCLQEAINFFPE